MITRRSIVIALGAGAFAPLTSLAPRAGFAQQQPAKIARIGFLGPTTAGSIASRLEGFRAGLRDLGYVAGRNISIHYRWAEGDYGRLPGLAAELVQLKVDVIVVAGTPGIRAAKQATTTIPIVIASTGDAVANGLVASLARPGGNITGSSWFGPEIGAKRMELIKEAVPRVTQAAYFYNLDNFGGTGYGPTFHAMQIAAKALKIELQPFGVRGPGDFSGAFTAMAKKRVDAVQINDDSMIIAHTKTIADLAAKQRLLSIGPVEFAEAGGLIGYGVNFPELFRRAAYFVDRILKGAKPSDLPVEQPTKFEFVVNMKTAKAFGLKIPGSILVRATKVIE